MASTFAKSFCQFFLGMAETVHQLTVTRCFLDRVQIRTLNVLYNRNFKNFRISKFSNNNRYLMKFGPLCSTPATLACYNFKLLLITRTLAHDQRLENPLGFNGFRQLVQFVFIKGTTRLIRIW